MLHAYNHKWNTRALQLLGSQITGHVSDYGVNQMG